MVQCHVPWCLHRGFSFAAVAFEEVFPQEEAYIILWCKSEPCGYNIVHSILFFFLDFHLLEVRDSSAPRTALSCVGRKEEKGEEKE
ncbi:hypothetical protein OIU76_007159 [Salix suchowensis]|nr:hypothetical protein OIU78_012305 [Salix suchowensis]KAJ6337427.1 hypothetical protein OIU76_007159 [Salix suchowensis]